MNTLDERELALYTPAELEGLRALFHDALRRNRQKLEIAMVGFVSTQDALRTIDKVMAEKREIEPNSNAS